MTGLLDVLVLTARDAERAEAGGADRVTLVGTLKHGGLSPEPTLVAAVRKATSVQVRPVVRLREGFSTDGGEAIRLKGLISAYLDAGADGMVLGFVNGLGQVDLEILGALAGEGTWPWTFHRAFDSLHDPDRAWRDVRELPRLDAVLTAGSARDVEAGLDDLLARAKADPEVARLIMAGGGLRPDHVAWLARTGVSAFQVSSSVRPNRSLAADVDPQLVHAWRILLDAEVSQGGSRGSLPFAG